MLKFCYSQFIYVDTLDFICAISLLLGFSFSKTCILGKISYYELFVLQPYKIYHSIFILFGEKNV